MEEPPRIRSRLVDARASALPPDLLYDILLRLPAKDLCRLRAVCRPWRSLLSDPDFITAHAARHPEPLIMVGYEASSQNGLVLCDIMDLSGRVIKRIHAGVEGDRVMRTTQLGLCVAKGGSSMSCQLLNPATGAVHVLPEGLAVEHAAHRQGFSDWSASIAFGLVASTGEYKVLRVLHSFCDEYSPVNLYNGVLRHVGYTPMKLYEVFTIGGSSQQARWRGIKAPRYNVELGDWNSVVIKHIVYFLLSNYDDSDYDNRKNLVASFDLETEKWSSSIRGPLCGIVDHHDNVYNRFMGLSWFDFKIAALGECLVLSCCRRHCSYLDLWILRDFEKGLWVKQYSIETRVLQFRHLAQPLLVLNDGWIANRTGNWAFLRNYDAMSITSTDVPKMSHGVVAVGFYGGSLLSVASGTSK